MPLALLLVVAAAALAVYLWQTRVPTLPGAPGGAGSTAADDPRIAVAAMLVAVATEEGDLTKFKEAQIVSLLQSNLGLSERIAVACLASGRARARVLHGDLTSRLHQLRGPIAQHCSAQEKDDVIAMLRTVAGRSAERLFSVRDAIGRLATSLADH